MNRLFILIAFLPLAVLPAQDGVVLISASSLEKHVRTLGSDSMEGRGTGSEGLKKAAGYITGHLKEWGLKPLGINNTFFQPVPLHGTTPLQQSELIIKKGETRHGLKLNDEYLLIKTGAQTLIPEPTQIVFVGYGIIAPEYDYDDYLNLDVSGKMVAFFDGEPHSESDDSYFEGAGRTVYSGAESKIRTALAQGAVGSIIIPNPDFTEEWPKLQRDYMSEEITLPGRVTSHLALFLSEEASRWLFKDTPFSLEELVRQERNHALQTFELEAHLTFRGKFKRRDFTSQNILALLPGSDPALRDSYLLLSAHYDHLGIGKAVEGDSIYNGVMDNAIGCAVLLEMARAFAQSGYKPRRSIIFAFWTGEEKGLLGSRFYTENNVRPLHKTIANINIDGLAALGMFKDVIAVGGELSSLGGTVLEVAAENGLAVSEIPEPLLKKESFYRSDQVALALAGVPSVAILEGFRYDNLSPEEAQSRLLDWFENIYHSPSDDLGQPINWASSERYADFLFALANRLANMQDEPQWQPGIPYKNTWLRNRAERR